MAACLHFLGRYQEALDMAREVRQRFPRSVYQVDYEVRELAALGQIDSVRARLEESLALAPGLWPRGMVYLDAAQELAAHGHPDDARQVVAAGLALSDGNSAESTRAALDLRANLLSLAGRWDELEALARPLAMRDTTTPAWAGYLGVSAARRGNRARADSIARTLAERTFPYTFGAAELWRARIAAVLGDRARAMGFLREAIDHGFIFDNRLHVDGDLSGLRGYPPYDQLLQPAD